MIGTICVCGAGTMGRGIAQLMASHGYSTVLYDVDPGSLRNAAAGINQSLEQLIKKEKITFSEQSATLAHLTFTSDLNDCIADLVIEAIVERIPEKIALFNQLAELNHADTIFATNTSSLSVTTIAAGVQHPNRVAGMHFFNPPVIMKLIELVQAD
ncbi:MAG: 3-hydroxybutyryl-CoA dehydrogenase, partial [Chitinophagaceae bacterium]